MVLQGIEQESNYTVQAHSDLEYGQHWSAGLEKERQNSNSEKLSQGKEVFISEVPTL